MDAPVIRQLCPNCFASVELPPDAAGSSVPCPKCQMPIAVPAAYAPSVAASGGLPAGGGPVSPTPGPNPMSESIAPPPPGLNFPAVSAPPLPTFPSSAPTDSPRRALGFCFRPLWLDWVPVVGLSAILALTLFNWVGTYPGGIRVYSQSPWFALFGEISTNGLPDELLLDEKEVEGLVTGNRWLIAYLPLLIVATGLAWLERIIRDPNIGTIPGPLAWLPGLWPRRFPLLTALAAILLIILLVQCWRGFGLENAVKQKVSTIYEKQLAEADTTPKKQKVTVMMGQELAKYQLQGTTPLNVALGLHVIVLLGMLGRWWLHARGGKPYPELTLNY